MHFVQCCLNFQICLFYLNIDNFWQCSLMIYIHYRLLYKMWEFSFRFLILYFTINYLISSYRIETQNVWISREVGRTFNLKIISCIALFAWCTWGSHSLPNFKLLQKWLICLVYNITELELNRRPTIFKSQSLPMTSRKRTLFFRIFCGNFLVLLGT